MNDDYLWDGSGKPDPEVQRLEKLLGQFRQKTPAPEFPAIEPAPKRVLWFPQRGWLAAAAMVTLVALGAWYALRGPQPGWDVARLAGAPKLGSRTISETGRLAVGQALETDAASRARIDVGMIGEVEVEPNTRVRLLQARQTEHRLALDRGKMRARIWAPPRLFYVNTPSAVAVDLGCRYTLEVDTTGAGLLHVTMGWVAFEQDGRESFVPAEAMCVTRPGVGPGTPYFEDAPQALRDALVKLDFELAAPVGGVAGGVSGGITGGVSGGVAGGVSGGVSGGVPTEESVRQRSEALDAVLKEARKRDALTLWHLVSRTSNAERGRVYDRLAQIVPPPAGVTRDGILRGVPETQRHMRDLWWDALGLGDTSWWRMWKGPVPGR